MKYQDNPVVENYYIYLKDTVTSEDLTKFVIAFREKYCYKPSNLNIFDTSEIIDLIEIYPLIGKDYIRYANAFIAVADFDTEGIVFNYPYKDSFYKGQLKEILNT